ncbi:phytoene/squalene synthase family protein [Glutamicibacter sp.]|uniref:phytoene/squalene synthase family protein n=1 Tax=Glutamicibacter sp. TaxID=1931995 RepID=UPI002FC5D877
MKPYNSPHSTAGTAALEHYSRTAQRSARVVLGEYSTSFSLACKLLDAASARHIANIYALVRLADEIVDGVACQAGLDNQAIAACLDELEAETLRAMERGYSTNMVVHAFTISARATGIHAELTAPFFASMRADLGTGQHDARSLQDYIYGSAEVIGLMCLQVFQAMPAAPDLTPAQAQRAKHAARSLGAAFQKVNFLRDLAEDSEDLGRSYFPGLDPAGFDEPSKAKLVAQIEQDLAQARAGLPYLAPSAARAVRLAHDLFRELNSQLDKAPASQLLRTRISVSAPRKALIAARVLLGTRGTTGRKPRMEVASR